MLESLFNKAAGCRPEGLQRRFFQLILAKFLRTLTFKKPVPPVTLFTMHEKDTANET